MRSKQIRELTERAETAEALVALAAAQMRELEPLLDRLGRLAGTELPKAAEELMQRRDENVVLQRRAERAERDFLLVGRALIADEFPEVGNDYED